MQVLAINQNATIERLVSLSSGKMGYTLKQYPDVASAETDNYDFVIIDSELYCAGDIETLKTIAPSATHILIASKNIEKPQGFDVYLEKPFLPTELVEIYLKYQDGLMSSSESDFLIDSDEEEASNDDIFDSHIALDDNEEDDMAMPAFDVTPSDLEPIEEEFNLEIPESIDVVSQDGEDEVFNVDTVESAEESLDDISLPDSSTEDAQDSDDFTFNLDSVIEDENEDTPTEEALDDISLPDSSTEDAQDSDDFTFNLDSVIEDENEDTPTEEALDDISLPDFGDNEVDILSNDTNDTETEADDEFLSALDDTIDLPDLEEDSDSSIDDFMSELNSEDTDNLLDTAVDFSSEEPAEDEFNFDDMLERASADLASGETTDEFGDDLSLDALKLDDTELDLNFEDSAFGVDSDNDIKDSDLLPEISDMDLEMPSDDDLSGDIDFKFDVEDDDVFSSNIGDETPSILDEEDVNEIKDLLDEEPLPIAKEEFTLDDDLDVAELQSDDGSIDDLDSLSEEMMADALGVEIDNSDKQEDVNTFAVVTPESSVSQNFGNEISSPEVENLISALKAALSDDNVTINITISKNG